MLNRFVCKCETHGKRWCRNCLWASFGFLAEHMLWFATPLHVLAEKTPGVGS